MAQTETEQRIIYQAPKVKTWREEGHFVIPEVSYRGETRTYAFFEEMTPALTQEALIEVYEREKQAGNPHPTDTPLILTSATRGYELRNEDPETAERLRQFFRQGFRRFPNTLTRIHYSETDRVLHNVGTSDEYVLEGNIVGPDGFIDKIPDKDVLERVFGTQDIEKINRVSRWINGTDSYIWRVNSKPKQLGKRVAGVNAYGNRLYLNCDRGIRLEYPAFRVVELK